jgi:hypothetical protein
MKPERKGYQGKGIARCLGTQATYEQRERGLPPSVVISTRSGATSDGRRVSEGVRQIDRRSLESFIVATAAVGLLRG